MISKFEIGSVGDAARYHDKAFSRDGAKEADNYYLNEQAAAHWEGKGAEILGMAGDPVERQDFVNFLEGRLPNPADGREQNLADNARGADRRAGVDFTVSPPKSVSIAALVGQDERVVAAHQAANTRAMAWLEEHGALVRVRHNGNEPAPTRAGNLLYATVLHETDRSNQPQLHNHNVIVAAVYDQDAKKWRSLTNDELYKLRAPADVVYKTELAAGLRKAGYELEYSANNVDFEIKGISKEQLKAFSPRSAQIEAALLEKGIDPDGASFAARQAAALDSRAAKQDIPREELQQNWRETAREVRLDVTQIVDAARANAPGLGEDLAASRKMAMQAVTWGVEHLSEREQVFKLTDLAIASLKFNRKLTIDQVDYAIEQHVKNSQLVLRGDDKGGAQLLTTSKGIQAERELQANILAGKERGHVVLTDRGEFDSAVKAFNDKKSAELKLDFTLTPEQVETARNLLMHPDMFQGVQGDAGTGKTAVLEMVREVAEGKGWQVIGMATSASAAKELEASSGIKSQTVAAFFVERANATRSIQQQIDKLEATLADRENQPAGAAPKVERHRLHIENGDVSFAPARYVFDHQKGEVFKSPNSFANLLGNFFMDAADAGRAIFRKTEADDKKLSDRIKSNAHNFGIGAADYLGQTLSVFEQVGTVEAALARSTLYLNREAPRDPLARDLELKRAELFNLKTSGTPDGRRTFLVMDEASLTGARDAAKVSTLARSIGARVDYQGDEKQHGSVPAGRAFTQAQALGMNMSTLAITQRFNNATPEVKAALQDMKVGRFADAIARLDRTEVQQKDLAPTVASRYLSNLRELQERGIAEPKVGIVAVTNADCKQINTEIHDLLGNVGLVSSNSFSKQHLDDPKLTPAQQANAGMLRAAGVDQLVFRQNYREIHVKRDEVVRVIRFDVDNNRITAVNAEGRQITVNPMKQERFTAARTEERKFAIGSQVEARASLKFDDKSLEKVTNGTRGVIEKIDDSGATVKWKDGVRSTLTNDHLRFVDHAYARTSFKEQGATNDREIIALSLTGAKVFNRESAYVAASRAKDNTEIVTSDAGTALKNAGRDVSKSTALEDSSALDLNTVLTARRAKLRKNSSQEQVVKQQARGQTLSL